MMGALAHSAMCPAPWGPSQTIYAMCYVGRQGAATLPVTWSSFLWGWGSSVAGWMGTCWQTYEVSRLVYYSGPAQAVFKRCLPWAVHDPHHAEKKLSPSIWLHRHFALQNNLPSPNSINRLRQAVYAESAEDKRGDFEQLKVFPGTSEPRQIRPPILSQLLPNSSDTMEVLCSELYTVWYHQVDVWGGETPSQEPLSWLEIPIDKGRGRHEVLSVPRYRDLVLSSSFQKSTIFLPILMNKGIEISGKKAIRCMWIGAYAEPSKGKITFVRPEVSTAESFSEEEFQVYYQRAVQLFAYIAKHKGREELSSPEQWTMTVHREGSVHYEASSADYLIDYAHAVARTSKVRQPQFSAYEPQALHRRFRMATQYMLDEPYQSPELEADSIAGRVRARHLLRA